MSPVAPHPITPTRVETARSLRELMHALVANERDDETLAQVGALVQAATALLDGAPRRTRTIPDFDAITAMREAGIDPTVQAMGDRAVAGAANPTSVHLEPRVVDGEAVAEVWFGPAFEGAPGRVHGGIVAAVFDDLFGFALAMVRSPGFTGRLTVHFRAPVPIEHDIEFRARVGKRDGRKLTVHAEARLDGRLLAEADALFILVDQDHFATSARELLARDPQPDPTTSPTLVEEPECAD